MKPLAVKKVNTGLPGTLVGVGVRVGVGVAGKAQRVRTLIIRDFARAYERFDALLSPTSPTVAFELGAKSDNPLAMYLSDVLTLSASLAGIAGVSVPCGFDGGGLPIGLQIIGPAFDEPTVLRAADAYQRATSWHTRRPPL